MCIFFEIAKRTVTAELCFATSFDHLLSISLFDFLITREGSWF